MQTKHDAPPLRFLASALAPLAAAFLLVRAFGFGAQIIPPDLPFLGEEFSHFARNKDRYSVLFIGSSHVYYGVVPKSFDEESGRAGTRQTSCNLAAPNLSVAEADILLNAVLLAGPANLKWVFVDSELEDHWERDDFDLAPDRYRYWNNPEETWLLTRYSLETELSLRTLAALLPHWRAAFERLWSTGSPRLSLLPPPPAEPADENEGHWNIEDGLNHSQWMARFLHDREKYLQQVAAMRPPQNPGSGPQRSGYRLRMFERMNELASLHHVRLVFFAPPVVRRYEAAKPVPAAPFLAFDSPEKYPELYEVRSRFDMNHLTEKASIAFSRLLARTFAAAVRPR